MNATCEECGRLAGLAQPSCGAPAQAFGPDEYSVAERMVARQPTGAAPSAKSSHYDWGAASPWGDIGHDVKNGRHRAFRYTSQLSEPDVVGTLRPSPPRVLPS